MTEHGSNIRQKTVQHDINSISALLLAHNESNVDSIDVISRYHQILNAFPLGFLNKSPSAFLYVTCQKAAFWCLHLDLHYLDQ